MIRIYKNHQARVCQILRTEQESYGAQEQLFKGLLQNTSSKSFLKNLLILHNFEKVPTKNAVPLGHLSLQP